MNDYQSGPISDEYKASMRKLDKIIHQVNSLLKKAESTEHDGERKLYQAKAEELIDKYRIDQENMIAVDEKTITPILRSFPVSKWDSDFCQWMWTMFLRVADHCGVRTHYAWERDESDRLNLVAKAVGYEIDLRFMEILWSSIRLTFISKLEPEVDPDLSDEENIYRLRSSGIPRKDVAQKLWGKWTHSNSAKVGKVYKQECDRRGEKPALDGRGIGLKTFRDAYAREFTWRVDDRLRRARDAALAQGGALEFAGREDRIEEAYYKHFPDRRPKPPSAQGEPVSEPAQKARKRMAYHETKAYQKELDRKYYSKAAMAGSQRGKNAGDEVNISRTAGRTERLGYEAPQKNNGSAGEISG